MVPAHTPHPWLQQQEEEETRTKIMILSLVMRMAPSSLPPPPPCWASRCSWRSPWSLQQFSESSSIFSSNICMSFNLRFCFGVSDDKQRNYTQCQGPLANSWWWPCAALVIIYSLDINCTNNHNFLTALNCNWTINILWCYPCNNFHRLLLNVMKTHTILCQL